MLIFINQLNAGQAFTILEYPELRALIRRGAQTPMGRERVDTLTAARGYCRVARSNYRRWQNAVDLRKRGAAWTFSELGDPSEKIALLRVEGTMLDATAILELKVLSEQAMSARASILAERDQSPVLWSLGRKPAD